MQFSFDELLNLMFCNFNKIEWFNPQTSTWVIDYIGDDDANPFVISIIESSNKYTFCMSKPLAKDLYILLNNFINEIWKPNTNNKIVELGFHSNDLFIVGNFRILPQQENLSNV